MNVAGLDKEALKIVTDALVLSNIRYLLLVRGPFIYVDASSRVDKFLICF